ncbi:MAG: hypothetical protein QOI77_1148 [Blastocatellia bacterium]|jgi:hypothetical protein|nr:hypothetical protein [Blastocatellia bacterium]
MSTPAALSALSTGFPRGWATVVVKHGDDRGAFRFAYEIDGVWKLVKQTAAYVFIDNRKSKRTIGDAPQRLANFTNKAET